MQADGGVSVGRGMVLLSDVTTLARCTHRTLIGFLTVFRANLCYGRFEDGRKLIGAMCNCAREAVLIVYTYKEQVRARLLVGLRSRLCKCRGTCLRSVPMLVLCSLA